MLTSSTATIRARTSPSMLFSCHSGGCKCSPIQSPASPMSPALYAATAPDRSHHQLEAAGNTRRRIGRLHGPGTTVGIPFDGAIRRARQILISVAENSSSNFYRTALLSHQPLGRRVHATSNWLSVVATASVATDAAIPYRRNCFDASLAFVAPGDRRSTRHFIAAAKLRPSFRGSVGALLRNVLRTTAAVGPQELRPGPNAIP